MKTILAPVDFSSVTERVIAEAAALARSFDGRIVLLNITQPIAIGADTAGFVENVDELNEAAARDAARKLAALEDGLEAAFLKADSVQLTGVPAVLISEQAKQLGADYIVMGSHGHTAFYDLLVGSTASAVLKRAPCPVLVVPPPPKQTGKQKR